jgi:hypothetical protein
VSTAHAERTMEALGNAAQCALRGEYDLVQVEQHDSLPKDVVSALVAGAGEWETKGGEALLEWADDKQWVAACDEADELARDIIRSWEPQDGVDHAEVLDGEWPASAARVSLIDAIRDRDGSDWLGQLVARHGAVLLRVTIKTMDEAANLGYAALEPVRFLDLLGFEHTEHNIRLAGEVIDNASPEFSVAMGQALIGADLETIVDLPPTGAVELRDPHVWLGNPFAGSGWCSEEAFTGTLTVARGDLRTDEDAFGHSWDSVVGGASPSAYEGKIVATKSSP